MSVGDSAPKVLAALGRQMARTALAETGKTHRGKHGLGRKPIERGPEIAEWRRTNDASIAHTASHFDVSLATVKRYCLVAREEAAALQREADWIDENHARDAGDWTTMNRLKVARLANHKRMREAKR
jgi:hypothetical protein